MIGSRNATSALTGASVAVIALALMVLAARTIAQAPATKACGLVTASELQAVLGSPVNLKPGAIGDVQTCSGQTQTTTAMLRLFKRTTGASGDTEKAGIEAVKKMGVQVDVKTSGGITCVTMVPPANMAQMGFGTTCTVMSKAPTFAVVEVAARTQKDMVSMEKLRALAEKMATRF